MTSPIQQIELDLKRYVKKMGRNDRERLMAIDRLASDLGFRNLEHLRQVARAEKPGRLARQLKSMLAELFDQPRDTPDGGDELYEYWLADCSPAALDLVEAVNRCAWSWCDPSIDPFLFRTTHQWLERVRNTARMLQPRFRSPSPSPPAETLDGKEFQIILNFSGAQVSAWVGRLGFGVGCEFDRSSLTPNGDTSNPAYRTALGLAYAWYVDVSLPGIGGIPAMVTLAADDWAEMKRYVPHPTAFRDWMLECREVSEPRLAHWVVAHIRRLNVGQPSDEKLATAPRHLRPFMGPNDTWVIGHERSANQLDKLVIQLETHALVASAAGAGYWSN